MPAGHFLKLFWFIWWVGLGTMLLLLAGWTNWMVVRRSSCWLSILYKLHLWRDRIKQKMLTSACYGAHGGTKTKTLCTLSLLKPFWRATGCCLRCARAQTLYINVTCVHMCVLLLAACRRPLNLTFQLHRNEEKKCFCFEVNKCAFVGFQHKLVINEQLSLRSGAHEYDFWLVWCQW